MWMATPSTASAASFTDSDTVGCHSRPAQIFFLSETAARQVRRFRAIEATNPEVGAQHDDTRFAIDDRVFMAVEIIDPKPDDHGNTARARQHGDVARRAAGAERDGAAPAPVGFEKHRRGDILARQHRGIAQGRWFGAEEVAQHAVANVLEIGGAGAEILIIRCNVAADLGIERRGPGFVRRHPLIDRGKGRRRKGVIFKHGDLESEHLAAGIFDLPGQSGNIGNAGSDCRRKRRTLIRQ